MHLQQMKRLRVTALVAGVSVLALIAPALLAGCAPTGVTVGLNVRVNLPGPVAESNSPALARDPRDPRLVVAAYRVDRPEFSAALARSADGGRTWTDEALPLPPGRHSPYAPDVAFAPDGTLYATYVDLEGEGNAPADLWLVRSSDAGRTFSAPTRIAGRDTFQARLAAGPDGAVYVTWLQGGETGLLSLVGPPAPIVMARSTDGGNTFSKPVRVSDPRRSLVGAATPVIDSRGKLVVLYEDFGNDVRDFQFLPGPAWDRSFALVVTRPLGRNEFAGGVELEHDVVPAHRFLVYAPEFPSIAAGAHDSLYVAWADKRNGDEDVFLRRSADGGLSWSAARRVNDNPKRDGTSQYLPQVAVAPDGRVDILYLERRRDRGRNTFTDATLATSMDRGRSFTNVRLSSRSFDSRVGSSAAPELPVDFGSRLGLAATDGESLAAWTDTRLGSLASGRQDVFAATYQVR